MTSLSSNYMDISSKIVEINNLSFSYIKNAEILKIDNLFIKSEEKVFLFGPSGCGKTTLLSLIAGIIKAQNGSLKVLGTEFINSKASLRDKIRGENIGYIFQMFNLIPYFNVYDNIILPCKINKHKFENQSQSLHDEVFKISDKLKITDILYKNVLEISVGQQQRVAAARALILSPKLIIADEPTSSLDANIREQFLNSLFELCNDKKTTLIFVSHDQSLLPLFSTVISLPEINKASKI